MRNTEKAHRGQTIRTETGPDRSSHKMDSNEALMGRKTGGGPMDLSHSISGGDVADKYSETPPKPRR